MKKLICQQCMAVHENVDSDCDSCPVCNSAHPRTYHFSNSDSYLKNEVPRIEQERKELGLEGLVGGLEAIIISTEPVRQKAAVQELLNYTGLELELGYHDESYRSCVLKAPGSADFIVRSRKSGMTPFREYNIAPKSSHLPQTRLETFVFRTNELEKYVNIQKARGVNFLTKDIVHRENYDFIQTIPSSFTGNSIGFIQWTGERGSYAHTNRDELNWGLEKPDRNYLRNIGMLDHTATRVRAKDRDAAIIEFMELTGYNFNFAIYVKSMNSITNVARLSAGEFAMVFTSGISPFVDDEISGPTEKFIHNYGTRVHHLAFKTEHIEETFAGLKEDGMGFLLGLVGSPEEGLKQTFSAASPNTLLVNEYIHRYGDFDGFFTRSNVTLLTEATKKQ